MNSKIYACGYCGSLTRPDGGPMTGDAESRLIEILNRYPEEFAYRRMHPTQGDCCRYAEEERRQIVTREMAMDAGDMRLEGTTY